ncbi:hypothetical protein LPB90_03315 [Chryseobacterium sp. LC2016-29]|uniref:hypothetical protein n=1 Tax=Chryseobacterium sp. LC2016-29 TaxID=2897331 RepID=UPI001E2C4183|nr:hypothetical protein [Chryseobacterium sp. LC2016-29]MCD0477471.1 hypothetical protein [Chryseobacterium sp. LC2016-29]
MNNIIKLSRKELYDKVWATPMIKLAKEFNLSDNGLRKICKNFDIPIPPVGYWQKIQYGKKVNQLPLSKKDEEREIKINVDVLKQNYSPEDSIRKLVTEKIRNNSSLILKVNDRLSKPDDIVVKTQSNLENKKMSNSYEKVKGTISTSRGLPSIIVSPKNVSRSLRILDNLIKNFKFLGYQVLLNDEGLKIVAYDDDDDMLVYIREKSNAIDTIDDRGWKSRDLIPNGKLAVKISRFGTSEFVDTDRSTVENQIEKILVKIETEFQEMAEKRRQWKIEREKQEELRLVEEAKQQLKDNELNKFIEFFNDAHRWKKFMILKEYFEYMKSENPKNLEWIQWAEKKLDWYNPAKNEFDSLLDQINRDTLENISKKERRF